MKSQTPAVQISEHPDNIPNHRAYSIQCECIDPSHSHMMSVEVDDLGISVNIYVEVQSKSFWKDLWSLFSKGYIECDVSLLLSRQGALNYADVLNKSAKEMEETLK